MTHRMIHWAETKEAHTATKLNTLASPGDGARRFHSSFQPEFENSSRAAVAGDGVYTEVNMCRLRTELTML